MQDKKRIFAGTVLVLLMALFVDVVIDLWPTIGVQADVCGFVQSLSGREHQLYTESIKKAYKITCTFGETPLVRINLEGMKTTLSRDQGMLAIVALFGGLGGVLRSFIALFTSKSGDPDGSVALIIARPFAAVCLATFVYVCIRAVVLPQGNLVYAKPYVFIAISAVLGFFADAVFALFRKAANLFQRSAG